MKINKSQTSQLSKALRQLQNAASEWQSAVESEKDAVSLLAKAASGLGMATAYAKQAIEDTVDDFSIHRSQILTNYGLDGESSAGLSFESVEKAGQQGVEAGNSLEETEQSLQALEQAYLQGRDLRLLYVQRARDQLEGLDGNIAQATTRWKSTSNVLGNVNRELPLFQPDLDAIINDQPGICVAENATVLTPRLAMVHDQLRSIWGRLTRERPGYYLDTSEKLNRAIAILESAPDVSLTALPKPDEGFGLLDGVFAEPGDPVPTSPVLPPGRSADPEESKTSDD